VRDTVVLEKQKIPAVAVITQEFVVHAQNIARMEGHGDLQRLVLPYPLEGRSDEELDRIAAESYPRFLAMLGLQV